MSEATLNPPSLAQINKDLGATVAEEMSKNILLQSEIERQINLSDIRTSAIRATAERWRARADEMEAECKRQRKNAKGEITQSERAIAARMIMYRSLAKEMCEAAGIEW